MYRFFRILNAPIAIRYVFRGAKKKQACHGFKSGDRWLRAEVVHVCIRYKELCDLKTRPFPLVRRVH